MELFFSDAYQSETKAAASGNDFIRHIFSHYLFIEKDMELQDLWTFLKEDRVIAIPSRLFPLAPSLDPAGLESSYSLSKHLISWFILLNEPVGSMPSRGSTGHLANPQASYTSTHSAFLAAHISLSGFCDLVGFFPLPCTALPYIVPVLSMSEHTSSFLRQKSPAVVYQQAYARSFKWRESYLLKVSTVVCCVGITKNYFTSETL